MDSMLDMYLFETNTLLAQLDDILIAGEKEDGLDAESINEIFRIMHTIKGSSAMMQFESMTAVSHKIEDLFSFIRDAGIGAKHHNALFDLMFKSCDYLKSQISLIENRQPLVANIGHLEEEINEMLKKISSEDQLEDPLQAQTPCKGIEAGANKKLKDTAGAAAADTPQAMDGKSVSVYFEDNCGMSNLRAYMLVKDIGEVCAHFTYSPQALEDNNVSKIIAKNGLNIRFQTQSDFDKGIRRIESFLYTKDYAVTEPEKAAEDKNKNDAGKCASKSDAVNNGYAAGKQSLINVNLKKLDALMDLSARS